MQLPRFFDVKIDYPRQQVPDLPNTLLRSLDALNLPARTGTVPVAVTAGSRGITDIVPVLRTVVSYLHHLRMQPFLFPAMGSHGGATAEGQRSLLARLGITSEAAGAPIHSSMDTVLLGTTPDGIPVHQDRLAHLAPHMVVVNRVKRHTGFVGATGSGMMKMLAVGAGKHIGARTIHGHGVRLGYENAILSAARFALGHTPVLFAVGLVEDAYGSTAEVRVCHAGEMESTDRELLTLAESLAPRLPVEELDLLVVDRMGKNISGTGMDTHVVGRIRTLGSAEPSTPRIRRIFVRELTPESNGNAIGVGLADFTTDRLVRSIDLSVTYTNCLTSQTPEKARIPIHYPSDRQCIEHALTSAGPVPVERLRIIRIADTSHLSHLVVSEAVLRVVESRPDLTVLGEVSWTFDADGQLIRRL